MEKHVESPSSFNVFRLGSCSSPIRCYPPGLGPQPFFADGGQPKAGERSIHVHDTTSNRRKSCVIRHPSAQFRGPWRGPGRLVHCGAAGFWRGGLRAECAVPAGPLVGGPKAGIRPRAVRAGHAAASRDHLPRQPPGSRRWNSAPGTHAPPRARSHTAPAALAWPVPARAACGVAHMAPHPAPSSPPVLPRGFRSVTPGIANRAAALGVPRS